MATNEPATARKCKSADCGFKVEEGHDECCSCEARRRGVAFVVVATQRAAAKKGPYSFKPSGW